MRIAVAIVIGFLTASSPALAEFANRGVGTASCGRWIAERRAASPVIMYAMEAWLAGFITSYNVYVSPKADIARGVDTEGLYAWFDNHCSSHPMQNLGDAAQSFMMEMRRQ